MTMAKAMANSTLCERCPNKHVADSIRLNAKNTADIILALSGESGQSLINKVLDRAETLACEIESKGCGWFWGMKYKNKLTGLEEVIAECGIVHLRQLLLDQGALTEEALQAANIMRDQNHEDMESLVAQVRDNTMVVVESHHRLQRLMASQQANLQAGLQSSLLLNK